MGKSNNSIIFANSNDEMMRLRHICSAMLLSLVSLSGFAQTGRSGIEIDYTNPKKYTVAGVDVEGNTYFGSQQIVNLTGLQKGMEVTIPSDEMSSIVDRVWAQRFFEIGRAHV